MSEEEENNAQQPPVKPKIAVQTPGEIRHFDTTADAIAYLKRMDEAEDPRA